MPPRRTLALLLGLVFTPPARAADPPRIGYDPPPDAAQAEPAPAESKSLKSKTGKPTPEAILRGKGLTAQGPVFVLPAEENVRGQATALTLAAQELEQIGGRMVQLVNFAQEQQALLANLEQQRQNFLAQAMVAASETPPAQSSTNPNGTTPPGFAGRPYNNNQNNAQQRAQFLAGQAANLAIQMAGVQSQVLQAQFTFNNLENLAGAKDLEIQRRQALLTSSVDALGREYAALAADRDVQGALAALNRDSAQRVTLGPIENYRENLGKLSNAFLKSKGLLPTGKGKGFTLGADADVKSLSYLTEKLEQELADALRHQDTARHNAAAHARTLAEARASGAAPARIKKLETDAAALDRALGAHTQEVAAKRAAFLQCVEGLRKAVALSREKHEAIAQDDEVKSLIAGARHGRKGSATAIKNLPDAERAVAYLTELDAMIRTETLPLQPDKAAFWIKATVNGKPHQRLVLDPQTDLVRLSARSAAAFGVTPGPDDPLADVDLGDSVTLPARRTLIASIELGGFVVKDVECLVILKDYDAPPTLGARLLDRFANHLDLDAGKLTLTAVTLKPRPHARPKTPARR